MGKLPIGLQLYSVRDDMEKDFLGTLKALKEMGYTHAEFAGLYGHSAEEVKEMCAAAGINPYSAHVNALEIMEDLHGNIKKYADIGCKFIAIPWADASRDLPGGSEYDKFLATIRIIAAECKKYGIGLLYHNHEFEFEKIDGKNKLDILYADTTPEELATEIDTCWAKVGGENPAEYVKKYTGRAPVIHLKDYAGGKSDNMYGLIGGKEQAEDENEAFELRPIGSGVQDVASLLQAAEAAGANIVVVEQDEPSQGKSRMECAKSSIDYIKSIY